VENTLNCNWDLTLNPIDFDWNPSNKSIMADLPIGNIYIFNSSSDATSLQADCIFYSIPIFNLLDK
jgi:hypothetical protein